MVATERTPLVYNASTIRSSPTLSSCANIHGKGQDQSTKKRLWAAVSLAVLFFATELVAGYFANSLGIFLFFLFKYVSLLKP